MTYLFEEDIRPYNIFQLAGFINRCRTAIQRDLNIFPNDLPEYDKDVYENAVLRLCEDWEHHSHLYTDIYESKNYRRALLWLSLKKDKYILKTNIYELDISDIVFRSLIEQQDLDSSFSSLISSISKSEIKKINKYENLLSLALNSDNYRSELGKIISMERYKESTHIITVLDDINIEGVDISYWLKNSSRYKTLFQKKKNEPKKFYITEVLNDLQAGAITKQTYYDYINGDIKDFDKKFFANLSFFLHLAPPLVNKLFENDGYNIKNSKRLQDRILMKCYKIGFTRDYANILLKNAGFFNIVKKSKAGYYYLDLRPMGK